jgi:hypothetical protein
MRRVCTASFDNMAATCMLPMHISALKFSRIHIVSFIR